MDDIIQTLSKYPWLLGVGAILGLYLLIKPSSAPSGGGADYSATLASQEIATNAAVALAGIQVQRDAVQGQQNIALTQARKEIVLGAQNFALADKALTTDLAITSLNNATHMNDTAAKNLIDMFTVATGFMLGNRDLENQSDYMQKSYDLGMSGVMSERILGSMALTYEDAANARGNTLSYDLAGLNAMLTQALDASYYDNYTNVTDNQLKLNTQADETEIEINRENNATMRDFARRQKQIAKYGAKMNLFSSIVNMAGMFGQTALSRGI